MYDQWEYLPKSGILKLVERSYFELSPSLECPLIAQVCLQATTAQFGNIVGPDATFQRLSKLSMRKWSLRHGKT